MFNLNRLFALILCSALVGTFVFGPSTQQPAEAGQIDTTIHQPDQAQSDVDVLAAAARGSQHSWRHCEFGNVDVYGTEYTLRYAGYKNSGVWHYHRVKTTVGNGWIWPFLRTLEKNWVLCPEHKDEHENEPEL